MRTREAGHAMRWLATFAALTMLAPAVPAAEESREAAAGANWQRWTADNQVENVASLQRGARNFMNYCAGCHSLKYLRYERMAKDLRISEQQLKDYLIIPGDKPTDYILTPMPAADAENWLGKPANDLSLVARSRGTDWVYRFLKTFYADPTRPTGANNLQLENTAMPPVLSELQGVQQALFRNEEQRDETGKATLKRVFAGFEPGVAGRLSAAQYDEFVRDTVNFLDYVGEPAQVDRRQLGIWVVLFLLAFTWIAWLLKQEYWKDVH
jgi:ubiquinol-cytochrome c reductase cytochrome c1 subunit